ncbi:putative bifunctional diguanylate cyclase/phosphodiesterase [Dyella lutea]|uniref:EAL domain-containing protein n=1 Tax=Dyella lutea TaxID=2950441 RepID=A0ABT1FBP9_9GAMM|nr:EAL domain-containing protein [Dyella lutea]MCP1374797.1 EAL domain-containing protein [Dyella lutea]
MVEAAGHAVFGYYTAALVATACIAVTSSIQFLIIGLRQQRDRLYLSYAMLCLSIASLSFSNALFGLSSDQAHAVQMLRVMCTSAAVSFPFFFTFVGTYTRRALGAKTLLTITAIAVAFAAYNQFSPGTMFYSHISGMQSAELPWGEWITKINGVPSPVGWTFHLLTYLAFAWALLMTALQFRRGERLPATLLGLCLLTQFAALLWGDIVIDLMGMPYPYLDAFSFLPFVLLMGLSMASQLHQRTLQLERTTRHLREEAATREQAELSLRHLAYHDPLTGLPNRRSVMDMMAEMAAEARRHRGACAAMVIDLDNFKTINDALGHHVGDRLLEAVADRLLGAVPPGSALGRLGGDEFVVVIGQLSAEESDAASHIEAVAQQIRMRLAAPVSVDSRVLAVGASVGVALFGGRDGEPNDVIRRADIALYRAKAAGRNAVRLFEPDMQVAADERLELERGLRAAVEHLDDDHSFQLHFQPQVRMNGQLMGAEALLRWRHPTLGDVSPEVFIPIAEETGLIHNLGAWVVRQTCEHIRNWDAQRVDFGEHLAVNVSPWQLSHPGFVDSMERVVREAGVQPGRITLELTESALLQGFESALQTMYALAGIGFRLALDDFGTGYSSLAYLSQLPLHELKIDRSFICGLRPEAPSPLASFIVDVGHRLGMTTIAEGVESESQRATLAALGCDGLQGYLICPPLRHDAFADWLENHERTRQTAARQAP